MKIASHVLALATTVLCVASVAKANQIINGGFETGSLTPWVFNPGPNSDQVGLFPTPYFGGGSPAQDGNFIAAFNGGQAQPGGTLSQTFATIPGLQYTVQFDYGTTGGGPQSMIASVVDGATTLGTLTATASNPPAALATDTFTFVADGTSATLDFLDSPANNSNDLDGILDNVSVVGVPEPSSLAALCGLGVAGLILVARRRRKA